ncbi:hypothetical protein E2C01_040070 [Portunus trituberculatus]|uniref:Uncharacterized protein n=1 Tax=Portunus trituberculatus TaxID=210409 RepID=A0A5B7FGE7_PORTR|nr:hypothetical protein [Portunus trituberculatus]
MYHDRRFSLIIGTQDQRENVNIYLSFSLLVGLQVFTTGTYAFTSTPPGALKSSSWVGNRTVHSLAAAFYFFIRSAASEVLVRG